LLVVFEGLTPGFDVVFGGVVELSYLPPPWFVFEVSLEVSLEVEDGVEDAGAVLCGEVWLA